MSKKVFVLNEKTKEILVTSYENACKMCGKGKVDEIIKKHKKDNIDIDNKNSLKALWLCGFQWIVDIDTMKRTRLF